MNDDLADIPELADLESGRSLIRIPPEQNVPFTPRVRALVDTAEFQRLTEISQLGLVSRVYPGARHSRFEHALGVYHNALRYLQQLRKDQRFRQIIDRKSAELLIVAALLHDLGHWPYCHPIEDMALPELPAHESNAARYLLQETELANVLRKEWNIDPSDVLAVLWDDDGKKGTGVVPDVSPSDADRPRSEKTPVPFVPLALLRSILSGPIDVDKMDYLERDSLHCGVPYGRNFDKQRLIQSLVLNAAGDGLALTYKGKTAAELMVFARYVMFSEVYWHHAVRSATSMFARSFYELHGQVDLHRSFGQTDAEMISTLREAATGGVCEPLLDGVFGRRRRLFKRAAEYSHETEGGLYQQIAGRLYAFLVRCATHLAARLESSIGQVVRPTDVLIDAPPPHREVEFAVDIYFPQRDEYRPLRAVSPVVEALARTQFDEYVKRVRVFVAPHLAGSVSQLQRFDEELQAAVAESSG
jgi:HD superfamily phosphohydrolase